MKKLLPVLLSLLVLTGCSPEALPAGMDEEAVIAAGQEIVNLLVDGEYEEVLSRFREDVAAATSAEEIKALMEDAAGDAGAYRDREDAMATGRTVGGVTYGEAVILGKFEKATILFRVAFDSDWNFVGL